MKTTNEFLRIFKFAVIILVLGFFMQGVTAQSKKETPEKKKTRVEVRIIKDDGKGNVTKTDTAYEVSEDVSTKTIIKKIDAGQAKEGSGKPRQVTVKVYADTDDLDSLEKEIETTIVMDGDVPPPPPVPGMFEEELLPPGMPGGCEKKVVMMMSPDGFQGNNFPWNMMMTPWGNITKFEVKEKKHGKVITIETDGNGMMMMPPPPMPPGCGSKVQKQIRIEKEDGKPGEEKVIIIKEKKKGDTDRNE